MITNIIPTRFISFHELESTDNIVNSSSSSNELTLTNSYTYIFGDIEGDETLFNSTLSTINSNFSNPSSKFIFLGDLYDYAKPTETINMIEKLLNALHIPILKTFNNSSREIDVIRAFRKLWKQKQMKAYSKYNIQYLHAKLKPEKIPDFKTLFILGNKEVIFVQELIACEHITKSSNGFSVPAEYKYKKPQEGQNQIKHTVYLFTPHHLNVMLTFISQCYNFAIIDSTLFIHCYINYKHFKDESPVNRIVSGHSKGYGRFSDSDFPDVEIYLCDLTGLNNTLPLNNYIINDHDKIKYNFNDNFKPCLDKISFDVDEGIKCIERPVNVNNNL